MPSKNIFKRFGKPPTGVFAEHLQQLYSTFPSADAVIRNGHILKCVLIDRKSYADTTRNVVARHTAGHIKDHCDKIKMRIIVFIHVGKMASKLKKDLQQQRS